MDFEQARFNMVEQQIRTWEVLDQSVLELLFTVKREDFVPAAYRAIAFTDMEIPLGHDQLMMAPKLEARIVQDVAPLASDHVLEIGTGSGYLTALLAKRAAHVTSIEYFEDLSKQAAQRLQTAGIGNVTLHVGDGATPAATAIGDNKFDVIVLTGSVPLLPEAFLRNLNIGGRLFAIVGDAPVMKATLIRKTGDAAFTTTELFETVVLPLIHAPQPSRFDF
ncbi:MAG: protein-L-isoaspartate O-methyltransferase [Betaproteobacteria bacterium]|nr:protein-L-isoaspartate O-methyltransferase [Betaproteobacteria bacterium]